MTTQEIKWLSYGDIRQKQRNSPLRQSEIPVEHAVSLPIPTLRFTTPAYVGFISPARRQPQQPIQQGAPDRWWALDARSGLLVLYAMVSACPIASGSSWSTVTLPQVERTVEELRQALTNIETQMNALAPAFFTGEAGDKTARAELSKALQAILPDPLLPQYHAAAPDFFQWLDS